MIVKFEENGSNAYQFNIDKIVSYLEPYKGKLEMLYDWKPNMAKFHELNICIENALAELHSKNTSFEKDEYLKGVLSEALKKYPDDSKKFGDIAWWIIHDWGGIHGGTRDNTLRLVSRFLGQIESPTFERIASTSKVAAFMYPDKYVIYDSRVAYAINWILLKQEAGKYFFPVPEGRNSRLQAFPIQSLIRLKHKLSYASLPEDNSSDRNFISKVDSRLFIDKNKAYTVLNDLLMRVNQKLWFGQRAEQPFYTEMLLFALATKNIFDEIVATVELKIN